ncbi:DsbA family protein [Nocardia bovistercoris]|uniref:DsbA family protein n=1 Tax=Nocardia bovistercoris TaxID=2785916 RepID=A0A931MYY8_9NOCA|nr:thioredoxin domain-containing protein [Nocardia bovistercoris]MBH0775565.1 DsbA family protein [Nocardia bovistercoris]
MSNTTTYALGGVAVVVIALIVILVMRWSNEEAGVRNDGYGVVHNPAVVSVLAPDGAILLGRVDAANTIDLYEDPLCPACGEVERVYAQEIAQKIDEGALAVRYRFVNFLDPRSASKDYSTRAIAANECVAEAGSGPVYAKFHELLFVSDQPEENGDDLSNQQLGELARKAGASEEVVQCVVSGAEVEAAKVHAKTALDQLNGLLGGKAATPSVYDGPNRLDVNNENWVVEVTS